MYMDRIKKKETPADHGSHTVHMPAGGIQTGTISGTFRPGNGGWDSVCVRLRGAAGGGADADCAIRNRGGGAVPA